MLGSSRAHDEWRIRAVCDNDNGNVRERENLANTSNDSERYAYRGNKSSELKSRLKSENFAPTFPTAASTTRIQRYIRPFDSES